MIAETKDVDKLIKEANKLGFKLTLARFTKVEGCIKEETLTLVGWVFSGTENERYIMESLKKKA